MVLEISIEGEMLESACINILNAIDVLWALLMKFFVIFNPD